MQQPSTFQVYNASAGSGKTFTLVKEYLKVLLIADDIFTFQKILAITFTNKAAGEMKQRVLQNLEDFSSGKTNDLLKTILEETQLDKTIITEKSKRILDAILQNYTAFSITTIDSFTYKIIRSFAFDLGLSLNFEVEMDAVSLLNEAVAVLISKIGTDEKLTKILIDYSLEKTNDDKSWDISNDLNEFAKILLNEDDNAQFKLLATKNIDDFTSLKSKLFIHQKEIEKEIKAIGEEFLSLIDNNNLSQKDFYRGVIPKFFNDVYTKGTDFDFLKRGLTIEKAFENNQFYTKTVSDDIAASIDRIITEIIALYEKVKVFYKDFLFNKLALQSIIPLAVLNKINNELEQLKKDNNIRLNAEFNQLISNNIKNQPAPFIYERIGQRFMHYFIDEMQDTSSLQWQNLIPLIDNALAQEKSSLLLVGDGKQAIYRWRGGKAEQFINLGNVDDNRNSFPILKEVKQLETNYRSYSEIIDFTNSFFTHSAKYLQNNIYKELFLSGNNQQENSKKGGFVTIRFLEKKEDKENDDLKYAVAVLEKINSLQENFSLSEICILTRTKKDGITIADYLTNHHINIVSSETLLLQNNAKVNFIISLLQFIDNPNNDEAKFDVLTFLYEHKKIVAHKHEFLSVLIAKKIGDLFSYLKNYTINFNIDEFHHLPLYDKIEEIISSFHLVDSSDAYIQFFLDIVLEQQLKTSSITEFLDFWETKKEKLSITASENSNAVQIMTIHKSKGLEFPVVIFPCDVDIYRENNPKAWLNSLPERFDGFQNFLFNKNKSFETLNNNSSTIYNTQKEQLELDNLNLLYVALTRPIEQLHIISEKKVTAKNEFKEGFYSSIFYNYLKEKNIWDDENLNYTFGTDERLSKKQKDNSQFKTQHQFTTSLKDNKNTILLASSSLLWNTKQEKAIDYGNLLHEVLAKINIKEDIPSVLDSYLVAGKISNTIKDKIKEEISNIINHPLLRDYYSNKYISYNEREHLFNKSIFIPDKLIFNSNQEAIIIDYKTGSAIKSHEKQLLDYKNMLKNNKVKIYKTFLIYLNKQLIIKEV